MFAYQRPAPQTFPYYQPALYSQPSRVELLRAELAQAEQEAAFSRQRRYNEILEEERLRAQARRQVEEEELQARINRAKVLQLQEQARHAALQREIEAQKRAALAQTLREERRRTYQSEQRKLLQLLFGAEDEKVESSNKTGCPCGPAGAPLKRGKATRRASVEPKLEAKEPSQPQTLVIDFAELFGLSSKPAERPQSSTSKPIEPTESNQPSMPQTVPQSFTAKAKPQPQPQRVERTPSVESRPDLEDIQKSSELSQPQEPTKDVHASLSEVATLASAFDKLRSEFAFPETLDFTPTSSRAASRSSVASDTEDSSTISKLAYTTNNTPLRVFENAASKLLNLLDSVESFGDADVRKARKALVERIENELEEVEREVSRQWRGWSDHKEVTQDSVNPIQTPEVSYSEDVDPAASTFAAPIESDAKPVLVSNADLPEFSSEPSSTTTGAEEEALPEADLSEEVIFDHSSEPQTAHVPSSEPDLSDSTILSPSDEESAKQEALSLEATITLPAKVNVAEAEVREPDSESESDAFLSTLPEPEEETAFKVLERVAAANDVDSDWSEVEA